MSKEREERVARAMQGVNAIRMARNVLWEDIEQRERDHWITLAKAALLAIEISSPTPGQLQQIYARTKYFREELDRRKDEATAPYKNEDLASMRSLVPDIETLIKTITSLEAQSATLAEVLKPFAALADNFEDKYDFVSPRPPDAAEMSIELNAGEFVPGTGDFTVGDLRRIRSALSSLSPTVKAWMGLKEKAERWAAVETAEHDCAHEEDGSTDELLEAIAALQILEMK